MADILDTYDDGQINEEDMIPNSNEAEQALLGAILYDNEVYHRVSSIVTAQHFYNPVHIRIYDSISVLIEHGKLADAIVLKNRFSQDETLVDIGGIDYLALLLESRPDGSAAPEYAKMIFDLALRRELIRLGGEMKSSAEDPENDHDARAQISEAEGQLFSLAETGAVQSGFVGFDKALMKSVEMATAAFERDGGLSGMSTGLTDLDKQLGGLHKSDLIILAGRPSMGKTGLATNIAFHIAKAYKSERDEKGIERTIDGGIVGFFSLEMSADQLATRLLAEQSGVPSNKIRRGDITQIEYSDVRDAAEAIEKIPLHIDDTGGLTIGALSARARRLKRMVGLDLIIVDYLQLLSGSGRPNDGRVQEVTQITMGLKALAKDLDVPVLALAQLSRQVEQRDDKKPQLSDLRESGSIEQDADVVMFVYRAEYYKEREKPNDTNTEAILKWQSEMDVLHGKAEIIVGKQRHGPIGSVPLSFTAELIKFGDLAFDERYNDSQH